MIPLEILVFVKLVIFFTSLNSLILWVVELDCSFERPSQVNMTVESPFICEFRNYDSDKILINNGTGLFYKEGADSDFYENKSNEKWEVYNENLWINKTSEYYIRTRCEWSHSTVHSKMMRMNKDFTYSYYGDCYNANTMVCRTDFSPIICEAERSFKNNLYISFSTIIGFLTLLFLVSRKNLKNYVIRRKLKTILGFLGQDDLDKIINFCNPLNKKFYEFSKEDQACVFTLDRNLKINSFKTLDFENDLLKIKCISNNIVNLIDKESNTIDFYGLENEQFNNFQSYITMITVNPKFCVLDESRTHFLKMSQVLEELQKGKFITVTQGLKSVATCPEVADEEIRENEMYFLLKKENMGSLDYIFRIVKHNILFFKQTFGNWEALRNCLNCKTKSMCRPHNVNGVQWKKYTSDFSDLNKFFGKKTVYTGKKSKPSCAYSCSSLKCEIVKDDSELVKEIVRIEDTVPEKFTVKIIESNPLSSSFLQEFKNEIKEKNDNFEKIKKVFIESSEKLRELDEYSSKYKNLIVEISGTKINICDLIGIYQKMENPRLKGPRIKFSLGITMEEINKFINENKHRVLDAIRSDSVNFSKNFPNLLKKLPTGIYLKYDERFFEFEEKDFKNFEEILSPKITVGEIEVRAIKMKRVLVESVLVNHKKTNSPIKKRIKNFSVLRNKNLQSVVSIRRLFNKVHKCLEEGKIYGKRESFFDGEHKNSFQNTETNKQVKNCFRMMKNEIVKEKKAKEMNKSWKPKQISLGEAQKTKGILLGKLKGGGVGNEDTMKLLEELREKIKSVKELSKSSKMFLEKINEYRKYPIMGELIS